MSQHLGLKSQLSAHVMMLLLLPCLMMLLSEITILKNLYQYKIHICRYDTLYHAFVSQIEVDYTEDLKQTYKKEHKS